MRKAKLWTIAICIIVFMFIITSTTALAASYNGHNYTTDYTQWKQSDAAWGSKKLGNLCTMSDSGCLVTSIAIQMVRAGVENPNSFCPGTLRDRLEAGGFISHASDIRYDGNLDYSAAFSGSNSSKFTYAGMSNFHPTPYNSIYSTLSSKMSQGYYAVVQVKYGNHWVAVSNCSGGEVYINDPASNGYTRLRQYDGGIESAIYFKANSNSQGYSEPCNPEGCFDSASGGNGTITIRGWALDRNSLETSLKVHVYVGGPYNSGAPGYEITANKYRPDVNNALGGVGNYHGFSETINVSVTGQKTIYVYAINVGGSVGINYNTLLGTKTVTISAPKTPAVISGQNIPGTLNQGKAFSIYGTISSGSSLTEVVVGVYDAAGNCKTGKSVRPYSTSYNIHNVDNYILFNKLAAGAYFYRITATNSAGKTTLVNHPFIVLGNGRTVSNGTYSIMSRANSGYGLSILNNSNQNAANVHLWTASSTNYKKFKFVYQGNGYYTIQNAGSGKYLDVNGASGAAGTNVQQYQANGSSAQLWQVLPDGSGAYYLVPKCGTSCCLDLANGKVVNGQNVRIWTANLSNAQRWYLNGQSGTTSKGTQTIGASSVIKTVGDASFNLGAKLTKGNGKLSYSSNNSNVATVSSSGKVTIRGAGIATITIKASETTAYKAASKKVTVTVRPKSVTISSLTNNQTKKLVVKWKRNSAVNGYQIQYAVNSSFSGAKTVNVTSNKTLSKTLSVTKGKTYYVRIRTYKGNLYSAWSSVKKLTIKK